MKEWEFDNINKRTKRSATISSEYCYFRLEIPSYGSFLQDYVATFEVFQMTEPQIFST